MRPLILATASLAALLAGACSSRVERFDYPLAYAEDNPNPNRLGMPTKLVTVRPGETLVSIAQRFGITPNAIRNVNGLKTDELVPGQLLAIPQPIR